VWPSAPWRVKKNGSVEILCSSKKGKEQHHNNQNTVLQWRKQKTEKWCDMPSCLVICSLHWLSGRMFETPVNSSRTVYFLPAKSWGWLAAEGTLNPYCDEGLYRIQESCDWFRILTVTQCPTVSTSLRIPTTIIFSTSLPVVSRRLTGHEVQHSIESFTTFDMDNQQVCFCAGGRYFCRWLP